jgi:ASPIC/UnbV protein
MGRTTRTEIVEVKWPSSKQQTFQNVEADRFYVITEGTSSLSIQQFTRNKRKDSPGGERNQP